MNRLEKFSIYLAFILSGLETVASLEKRVLDEILSSVSPHAAPPLPVNVSFSLDVLCFIVDQETRRLHSVVEERYLWNDPRVAWENDVNKMQLLKNANTITASSSLLWTPDIRLYNRIKMSDRDRQVMARIFYDGTVAWFHLAVHYTLCNRGQKELVLDNKILQLVKCRLKFGPWTHLKDEVFLSSMDGHFHDLKHYDGNCAKVNSLTSSVVETYSSSMVYYDIELVVKEVARQPETPPPRPPPPVDPEPEPEPSSEALTMTAAAAGGTCRSLPFVVVLVWSLSLSR